LKVHHLKLDARWFKAVADLQKTFEVRYDDRGYQVGDYLILEEVTRNADGSVDYTGFEITAQVSYILRADDFPMGLQPGYVVMAIKVLGVGEKLSNERYRELIA